VSVLKNEIALPASTTLCGDAQIEFVLNKQQPTVWPEQEDGNVGVSVLRYGGGVAGIEHADLVNLVTGAKVT
jgi:hypothetical protein